MSDHALRLFCIVGGGFAALSCAVYYVWEWMKRGDGRWRIW